MFSQFERYFPYRAYGEDQESIRGLEVELEWENAETSVWWPDYFPESARDLVN